MKNFLLRIRAPREAPDAGETPAIPGMPALIAIACLAVAGFGCSKSEEPAGVPAATTVPYAPVQAIFTKNCVGCHGATGGKGGINLTTYDSTMKGGGEGPIVVAGDPDKSKLVDALLGRNGAMKMPKGAAPLSDADVKAVEDWIKAGAKA